MTSILALTTTKRCILISAGLFALLVLLATIQKEIILPSVLLIELKARQGESFQVFFDAGKGYGESSSKRAEVSTSDDFVKLKLRLPAKRLVRVRIDVGSRADTVLIRTICLKGFFLQRCWAASDIATDFAPRHDISEFTFDHDLLRVECTGSDPFFEYRKTDFVSFQPKLSQITLYGLALLVSLLLLLVLIRGRMLTAFLNKSWFISKCDLCFRHRYGFAFVVFAVLVTAKVHGSSLPCWDKVVTERIDETAKTVLLGKARGIRSDEWLMQTPLYLSQAENEEFFPLVNKNIRSEGQNMVLSFYAPVFDLTLLGKPFNWGFVLFGKEYGLAWFWWSKLLLLFLLSFELSLILTAGNRSVSVLGAIWITFSPFIQWVYSLWLVDLIVYAQGLMVSFWHYIHTRSKRKRLLLMAVFALSSVGFIFSLYPRFQVPLAYVLAAWFLVILFRRRSALELGWFDAVLCIAAIALVCVSVLSFIPRSTEAMKTLLGTVNPGKHLSIGGTYEASHLQLYLINWLLPYVPSRSSYWNEVELSTFLNFLPACFLIVFKVYKLDPASKHLLRLFFCCIIFQLLWLFVGFPEWFARYSLLSFVTEQRLQVILNLLGLYLSILVFHLLATYKPLRLFEAVVITGVVMGVYYYSLTRPPMSEYLKFHHLVATLILFFVLNLAFLLGDKRLFGTLLVAYTVVAGLTVNPVARGLGPIENKVAAQKIRSLDQGDPGQKWAGVNSIYLGSYLISLGLKTFNGIHFYPDLPMWRILDPEGKYRQVYNRYGYVIVQLTKEETFFESDPLHADVFTLHLGVKDLGKAQIKYLLSKGPLGDYDSTLTEVERVERDNLYFYRVGT